MHIYAVFWKTSVVSDNTVIPQPSYNNFTKIFFLEISKLINTVLWTLSHIPPNIQSKLQMVFRLSTKSTTRNWKTTQNKTLQTLGIK